MSLSIFVEWVWVSKRGRSLEYFRTRRAAIEFLRAQEREEPGVSDGWFLVSYSRRGHDRGGLELAEELLS